jgi:hypothetical protein
MGYSASDEQKRTQDRMADLRAKGIDVRGLKSLIPGGTDAALTHMEKNLSATRDQSQEQTSKNRAHLSKSSKRK